MHQSQIIQHLFQVNSLEDVSRERLETFVEEYPSFGIGHYLLSRKLQKEDARGFEEKTQLTCLYFSNPFWLQWLLENTDVGGQTVVPEEKAFTILPQEAAVPEPAGVEPGYAGVEPGHAGVEPEPVGVDAATPLVQEWAATGEAPMAALEVETPHVHEELEVSHPATEELPPTENVVTMAEEVFNEEPAAAPAMEDEAGGKVGPSAAEQLLQSIQQARELRESLLKINTELTQVAEPVHQETPIRDEEVPFVLEEPEEPVAPTVEPVLAAEPAEAVVEVAAEPAVVEPAAVVAAVQIPVEDTAVAPGIVFEPLHTIDYFASQGIKFTLEENPADALGKQLKSFTDWLKTMRRLPQKNREVIPDRLAEQAVQDFAAHSIEGKEVLTEAMAEVLAKQGMRQRARAVYEKLSLLNPEKRAYFAAKIEQLNIL